VYHPIKGCENTQYVTNNGDPIKPAIPVEDFKDELTCPIAFYKNIEYTFRGVKLAAKTTVYDEDLFVAVKALIEKQ
jgi:hypothetical protein